MKLIKLSAVIIAKNEEKMIRECLESVLFADEIIVIDSGSSDNTLEIARELGAKVHRYDFINFADLRNYAKTKSSGEWLLYIDADERISKNLEAEITKTIISSGGCSAFSIPRLNIFFGKPLRWGGWYPDYQTKLFLRENLINWFGDIHESPRIRGNVGTLNHNLIHLSHRSLKECFVKSSVWTKIEANLLSKANHPPVKVKNLVSVMAGEFCRRVIFLMGARDGKTGWFEGIIQALNKFLVYAQLWEKQQQKF